MRYELHNYADLELPIIFHKDQIRRNSFHYFHCHQNPELLLVQKGRLWLNLDGRKQEYAPGQMAVVDRNVLHAFATPDSECVYYCLIIDHSMCSGIKKLPEQSSHPEVIQYYRQIIGEMDNREQNYRVVVLALCRLILALLSRQAAQQELPRSSISPKIELVRKATEYLFQNFTQAISLESISAALNVNKYYLSHAFKEVTGKTVVQTLQFVRCKNAQALLAIGKCNVAQAAYSSGFNHLSHFSKVYKACMGQSPTADYRSQIKLVD